jgi:hypothetical protein
MAETKELVTKELIVERCKTHVPDWKDVDIKDVTTKRMGGLSNVCYKVESPGCQPILYRLIMNQLANSEMERVIFKVASDEKIGPKLLK